MHHLNPNWNPYIPFTTADEWKKVALATQHQFGKRFVDDWIKGSLWKVESFQSAEHMWKFIDSLPDALGPRSWRSQSLLVGEDGKKAKYPFYNRNPLDCVRLLLHHLPFKEKLVWARSLFAILQVVPVTRSQSLTASPFNTEARKIPLSENVTISTKLVWPSKTFFIAQVLMLHIITLRSCDAEANYNPSGKNTITIQPC